MESGILITNIKFNIDEKTIRYHFEKFGKIIYLNLVPDKFIENTKVCYVNYTGVDGAKTAIREMDKSNIFGDQIKISYKRIERSSDKINGDGPVINRNHSFGRGKGFSTDNFVSPKFTNEPVILRNVDIPLNVKIPVEIVELGNFDDILARPIKQTDHSKQKLNDILTIINKNVHTLSDVRFPEINMFYLAKWEDDNNFYRAKLLEKLGNNTYKVCFVDEGTSGDFVKDLKNLPKEIIDFPCQFLPCDLECEDSAELKQLIVTNGDVTEVCIYVTNAELKSGKYRINLFLGDNDVCDLFKKQFHIDPRKIKFPHESMIKRYDLETEITNFQALNYPKQQRDVFKIIVKEKAIISSSSPIDSSPIPGDILIYRQVGDILHRCVLESIDFINGKIGYNVRLIDENRNLNTSKDSLLQINEQSCEIPPRLLSCVMELSCKLLSPGDVTSSLIIKDYDIKKNIYVVKLKPPKSKTDLVGQTLNVFLTHTESCMEFYVQFADNNSVNQLEFMQNTINNNYSASKFNSIKDLNVNQVVVAPYMEVNYRALVKEIDDYKCMVRVFFIDFGNCEWVKLVDIMQAKGTVTVTPSLAHRCCLPVKIYSSCMQEVTELLNNYCGAGETELSIKVLTDDIDVLCVNLFAENKSSFVDILQIKKFVDHKPSSGADTREKLIAKINDLEIRISQLEKIVSLNL